MEKIWLQSYPEGVPATVDVDLFRNLPEFILQQCRSYSNLVAFENFGSEITFCEFEQLSLRFAAFLQSQLGLKKGDRFAIMLPNIIQFPIALFGILRAGLIVVNVNPLYTAHELAHQLQDSGAKGIIVMENFAHTLSLALSETSIKHVIVTRIGDCLQMWKNVLIHVYLKYLKHQIPAWKIPNTIRFKDIFKHKPLTFNPVKIEPSDLAFLQYTGGTTGVAKGAMLTHRNIIANIYQSLVMVRPKLRMGKDTIITALPLYHIFSLTGCFFFMAVGSRASLITNPRDMRSFIKILKAKPFNVFVGVNTLFNGLMHQPDFKEIDFSQLNLAISGGMALQRTVANRWQELTGNVIIEGYGLTEASPVITINPITNQHYTGSVGLPIPNTLISLQDEEGHTLARDQEGELCVQGPQVMLGYWQKSEETAMVLDEEGWLRTGDIARVDEKGLVYIVDRRKDMIIVSGFNVYPNEIEDIIMEYPGIKEVAVVGIPSEKTGEAVKAFIVLSDKAVSAEDILKFCHSRLTKYKVPKFIEFRDELPKSNVGKVLRRALRDNPPH